MFISREYAPAPYPPGGIGTYVRTMSELLARSGETVHVVAQRWHGAPRQREEFLDGRLIIHRVAMDEPNAGVGGPIGAGMIASSFPSQAFAWQAGLRAEQLVEQEGIDVIEAQEWEAPLYYFQLRRALNLGPARRPPCVVHLHSSTEQIFSANEWDQTVADYAPAAQMEAYSITNADAILAPSHFVADQGRARYGLTPSRLHVIRYPIGEIPHLARTEATWKSGVIAHVGRLERRKGVLEWAEAVAMAAPSDPSLRVVFVGSDTPVDAIGGATIGDALRERLPTAVQRRVFFYGTTDRQGVLDVLQNCAAAVIPSRWENLPYSCLESMCTGLPIIASPTGGMREVVEDGVSGWIAPDGTPQGLAEALQRARSASASERQRMGDAAASTVRRVCASDTIVDQHVALKSALVSRAPQAGPIAAGSRACQEFSVVVLHTSTDTQQLELCLESLREQTQSPLDVRVIACAADHTVDLLDGAQLEALRATKAGLVVVESSLTLHPDFLACCGAAMASGERIGVVSAWAQHDDHVFIQPRIDSPYEWTWGQNPICVALDSNALIEASTVSSDGQVRLDRRLFDTIRDRGWAALTYPSVLIRLSLLPTATLRPSTPPRYSSMARAVQRLHTPLLRWLLTGPREDVRDAVRQGLKAQGHSLRRLVEKASRG